MQYNTIHCALYNNQCNTISCTVYSGQCNTIQCTRQRYSNRPQKFVPQNFSPSSFSTSLVNMKIIMNQVILNIMIMMNQVMLNIMIMKSDWSWSRWSGPSSTVELRAAPDAPVLQELLFQIAGEWRRGLRDNDYNADLMLCPIYSLYTIHYNAHRISSLFIILHHSLCITTIIIILFQLSRRNGNSGGMLLPHLPQVAEIFSIDYLQIFSIDYIQIFSIDYFQIFPLIMKLSLSS